MGIAILGVCLLHAFAWAGVDQTIVAKIMAPIARIAFTEGFLFLSGFGLYYSFSRNSDIRTFYTKRVHRVLLPYMIMTTPFFIYGFMSGNSSLSKIILQSSTLYFWFCGNDGMWYISMSMALYLIFPLAYRFMFFNNTEKGVIVRTTLLVGFSILICYGLYRYAPDYYHMVNIGISKTPIFFLGMLIGYFSFHKEAMSLKYLIGGGTLLCLMVVLKSKSDFCVPFYEIAYRLLMMPLACICLKLLNFRRLENFLSWFGKYSLEIYVLQMLIIGTMDKVLQCLGFQSEYYQIWQTVLAFGIVLAVCAPVHNGIDRIIHRQ